MSEVRYMISDAARLVDVEAHVLRYWEEELELPIGRNEMGHRYYTEENIQLFQRIRELKEQGVQLKAIKDAAIPVHYEPADFRSFGGSYREDGERDQHTGQQPCD